MTKQVFHYRTSQNLVQPIALFIGGGLWSMILTATWANPHVSVNGVEVSPAEARKWTYLLLAAGVSMVGAGIWMTLHYLNSRVEIEHGEIRRFDSLNRLTLTAPLSSSKMLPARKYWQTGVIETNAGQIKIRPYLNNPGLLAAVLRDPSSPSSEPKFAESTFQPTYGAYGYRGTSSVYIGPVFVIVSLLIFGKGMISVFAGQPPAQSLIFVAIMSGFLWFGVWLTRMTLNERIEVSETDVTWRGVDNKPKIVAGLREIISAEILGRTLQIETLKGTISISNQIKGSYRLVSEMQNLVAGRAVPIDPA